MSKNLLRMVLTASVAVPLFVLSTSPVYACDDPCPSLKLGEKLQTEALARWSQSYETAPLLRGVSSYFVEHEVGHYITFVADPKSVLVGEADCGLSHPSWSQLKWEQPEAEELETVSLVIRYYDGIFPIMELKKARYGESLTVYLLTSVTSEFHGKPFQVFKLFSSDSTRGKKLIGGAFAYPFVTR